jgi:hypothetical protein
LSNRRKEENWFQRAAEVMVRESKTLAQAVLELEIPDITTREAANIERTKTFQRVLWSERHRFHKELANDPNRNKAAAIGQLQYVIQKLIEENKWDKAAEAILKMAKIEGWVGEQTQVNVFGSLSQDDINKLREEVRKQSDSVQ